MIARLCIVACITLAGFGCQSLGPSAGTDDLRPYAKDSKRDTEKASALQAKGAKFISEGKFDEAEKELKAAIGADIFNGEAHNNLGVVYFQQKRYYQAAWEFQYASKVMPNKAEPWNNLGMVMEEVGKLDDAAEFYEKAVAMEPNNIDATGNLARTYVRLGRKDKRTRELLTDILLKDTRPEWERWAKERITSMGPLEWIPPAPEQTNKAQPLQGDPR